MSFRRTLLLTILLLPGVLPAQPARATATAVVARAVVAMGGDSALRAIRTLRQEVLTQWLRPTFPGLPVGDQPSYERNTDLRDYAALAWRNTRTPIGAGTGMAIVDVVRDTIAIRLLPASPRGPSAWAPLNVAYVEERRQLFAVAPERLLPQLHAMSSLRRLPDTLVAGARHARVAATLDGWPGTIFFDEATGLPTLVRFVADEVNDFGLAQWGRHTVEFWYGAWARVGTGALLPRQLDVVRVGRPYKRMTVLAASVNAVAPADSFPVTDSLAQAYLRTERRPMWRLTLDSAATIRDERFASFPSLLGSAGAVRLGGRWLLLETAVRAEAVDLVAAWLARTTPDTPLGAGVVASVTPRNGGVRWFAERGLPALVAPGAAAMVAAMPGGTRGTTVVAAPRWQRIGTDSVWVEPVSAPDAPGMLAVYSPTLRWLYLPTWGLPAHQAAWEAVRARVVARGWPVERIGSQRAVTAPAR